MDYKPIADWPALVKLETELGLGGREWVFRGQCGRDKNGPYRLKSTLERACEDSGVGVDAISGIEASILSDFMRSCHLYSPEGVPRDDDLIEWFALARHYGAPSRFLDFTFSLFIAAYFALESSRPDAVIWAIDKRWLSGEMKDKLARIRGGKKLWASWQSRTRPYVQQCDIDHLAFKRLFLERKPKLDLIAPLNTFRTNDRLVVQQGLFLAATDVSKSFHHVLDGMPECDANVLRIPIRSGARQKILPRLHRAAVNSSALFPGLQGFAQSLGTKILTYLEIENIKKQDRARRVRRSLS